MNLLLILLAMLSSAGFLYYWGQIEGSDDQ
ncbi:hypothetical protein B14911_26770 [Bacillus sp. NRRL B-14911]|uniref:Uncharacterized protein n=1 Tax=Bacillus infantis NRRL B-14911 TaxID=1367477 RepID=U5LCY7_9BACI|nr:hypothetical protein N288_13495 [Bacillus infantis NRRL B-14911]EAR68331.1 hypothetical protein B14911_26770 [Bacillus sp. NRRL B-14911]